MIKQNGDEAPVQLDPNNPAHVQKVLSLKAQALGQVCTNLDAELAKPGMKDDPVLNTLKQFADALAWICHAFSKVGGAAQQKVPRIVTPGMIVPGGIRRN